MKKTSTETDWDFDDLASRLVSRYGDVNYSHMVTNEQKREFWNHIRLAWEAIRRQRKDSREDVFTEHEMGTIPSGDT